MQPSVTIQTLPSGRVLAIGKDGKHSFISIHDFEPKPVWPQAALERLTQALAAAKPPVQTNASGAAYEYQDASRPGKR